MVLISNIKEIIKLCSTVFISFQRKEMIIISDIEVEDAFFSVENLQKFSSEHEEKEKKEIVHNKTSFFFLFAYVIKYLGEE